MPADKRTRRFPEAIPPLGGIGVMDPPLLKASSWHPPRQGLRQDRCMLGFSQTRRSTTGDVFQTTLHSGASR